MLELVGEERVEGRGRSKRQNLRPDRIRDGIQPVFNLARLFSDCIQRAWITCGISSTRSTEGIFMPKIVARGATDVCHGFERRTLAHNETTEQNGLAGVSESDDLNRR